MTEPLEDTWRCHACGRTRADADIDVASEKADLPDGGEVRTNARYCADSADCEAKARRLAREWMATAA